MAAAGQSIRLLPIQTGSHVLPSSHPHELNHFFPVGAEWEEAEVCVCGREEVRKQRPEKCAEIFKRFSPTAMKGADALTYQRERTRERSLSSEALLPRSRGLLALPMEAGSIAPCSSSTPTSAENKPN